MYKSTVLSSDCSSVCFYGDRKVVVYSIRHIPETCSKKPCVVSFQKEFGKGVWIWDVAISKNYLVVSSTLKNVLVFRHTKQLQDSPLQTFPSDNFLSGLAIHETDAQLQILIGKGRDTGSVDGQITIHTCSLGNSSDGLATDSLHFKEPRIIAIPDQDLPKRIGVDQDGKMISCITRMRNTVLIWRADGESSLPFMIQNRYTPVRTPGAS